MAAIRAARESGEKPSEDVWVALEASVEAAFAKPTVIRQPHNGGDDQ